MYAAIIATLVIGLLIAYFFLSSSSPVGKSNKGTTITLVGAVNSGKTALFTYLRDGKASTTFTSMAPNEVNVSSCKALASVPGAQSLKLVDIPGHGRFANLQSIHFPRTRVIIFTVDARNDMLWKEVGEKLYTVLTSATLVKRHVPVIIACTKSEADPSFPGLVLPPSTVQSRLEAAVENIRKVRASSHSMASIGGKDDDDSNETIPLEVGTGVDSPGKFTFSSSPIPISIVSVSPVAGDVDSLVKELDLLIK